MTLSEVIHNGGGWDERDRRLILWHFEELLKQRYKEFIGVVEVWHIRGRFQKSYNFTPEKSAFGNNEMLKICKLCGLFEL